MVERASLIAEVERRLGNRRLVWAGLRGDDIEPLSDLPQLYGVYSVLGSYTRRSGLQTRSYEALTGVRVDPEVWDIDDHLKTPDMVTFRRELLRTLSGQSALLPYRPSQFLSAITFARHPECQYLGHFSAQQSAFEHKPWVEVAVARLGLPRVPWTYVADEDQLRARDLSSRGSVVLRRSRTSGGQGFLHVDSPEELEAAWPEVDEAFLSVAPFIAGATPVNVGATVWPDGGVTVNHPSVQLVGITSCVTREFGYCGNDFGLVRELEPRVVDQIETNTQAIGGWLGRHGYLGTFGVDYLVTDGVPLFTEVNPRFQGSTSASARLSIEAGRACLMLEHVAAWLGVERPAVPPLRELVTETPDFANLVVHWTGTQAAHVDAEALVDLVHGWDPSARSDVVAPRDVRSDPGSAVARFSLRRRVTATGFDLADDLDLIVSKWQDEAKVAAARGDRK